MVKIEPKLHNLISHSDIILYQRVNFFRGERLIFTVNIPFICQNCGKCCRTIGFPVGCAHLSEIGGFLGISAEAVANMLKRGLNSWNYKNLNPCIFLKDNFCSIYPVRPSACRYFPLMTEFKDYGIGCKGLKRIRKVEEAITDEYRNFISRSKFVSLDIVKNIRGRVPASVLRRFMNTNPSESEVEMFFILNSVIAESD